MASQAARAWFTGTPEEPIINFDLPTGAKGEPGVGWNSVSLAERDLNEMTSPGVFSQSDGSKGLLTRNYPSEKVAGSLMVTQWAGTNGVIQVFTSLGLPPNITSYGTWQRTSRGGSWTRWVLLSTQRVDNTAGRAIYTWDETNNREQMIYGDTGWRNVSAVETMLANEFTATSVQLRRVGNYITLNFDGMKSLTATGNVAFVALPTGFRPDLTNGSGNQRYGLASELTGINTTVISPEPSYGSSVNANMRFLSYATSRTLHGSVSFYTRDPWPTELPGTAIGTIPNN